MWISASGMPSHEFFHYVGSLLAKSRKEFIFYSPGQREFRDTGIRNKFRLLFANHSY